MLIALIVLGWLGLAMALAYVVMALADERYRRP